ncbi:MAG: threonine synthase [Acidimicrobiales bacterium]
MSGFTGILRCPRCYLERDETDVFLVCAHCAREGYNVNPLPLYDWTGVDPDPLPERRGLFAWQHLLPLADTAAPVTLGEGDTPLVELTRVRSADAVGQLWVKDESRNPTWSYKDRLIAVSLTKAREKGVDTVAVASTGNHGAAAAAYAARAGIRCIVLTVASVPAPMKTLMQAYGAIVVALAHPRDRWALLRQGVTERGWTPLSGFMDPPAGSNPYGIDGYKSIAYEIVRDLGRAPTVLVAPVAYGDGLTGILRGFEDLVSWGRIEEVPRLLAAEPIGPYRAALADGFDPGRRLCEPETTVAFSIASPVATFQGYDALLRSGGCATVVDDADLLTTQLELAASEGLYLEASSVATLATLPKLVRHGEVDATDSVVLLGTSTGLKDIDTTARLLPPVPEIAATMAELDAVVDGR